MSVTKISWPTLQGAGPYASTFAFPFALNSKMMAAPAIIATSATLNMPVRTGPIPSRMKSVTIPLLNRRSSKFPIPPAATRENPINCIKLKLRVLTMDASVRIRTMLTNTTKNRERASPGQLAPRPRKAPAFSLYSIRMESFRSEIGGEEASDTLAMLFVTWSQPAHTTSIRIARPSL